MAPAPHAGAFLFGGYMKFLQINTLVALENAPRKGIGLRNFVWLTAKNRDTGAAESIGVWNGMAPVTVDVVNPKNGTTISRDYVAGGALLSVPSIPATLVTEVRSVRIRVSNLSPAIINAIRLYDLQMAPVQIHRGIFDPETGMLVDPAECRFEGFVNSAPITNGKSGGEGFIEIECVSSSRVLTKTSATRFSYETIKARPKPTSGAVDHFGKYLAVAGAWRIWWGTDERQLGHKEPRKERWIKV